LFLVQKALSKSTQRHPPKWRKSVKNGSALLVTVPYQLGERGAFRRSISSETVQNWHIFKRIFALAAEPESDRRQ
jgi:hypothetical protein